MDPEERKDYDTQYIKGHEFMSGGDTQTMKKAGMEGVHRILKANTSALRRINKQACFCLFSFVDCFYLLLTPLHELKSK